MASLRRLFHEHRLLSNSEKPALRIVGLDPWSLRLEALDRILSGQELAVALGHIARHRGFRSNSKRDRGANAASDTSKMLKALDAARERLSRYRTVGEMMAHDSAFVERKRNRDGDYSRSTLRTDLEYEAEQIFAKQRAFGNGSITEELEEAFKEIAFAQRPLADSWDKVGACPFEPAERRSAKHAHSFELFRFLARLTSLRVGGGRNFRALTEDEIRHAANDFGNTKGMSFARLRKVCSIGEERFQGVPPADEKSRDAIARSGSAAEGLVTLKNVVGNGAWHDLLRYPERLDRVAEILAFFESAESIRGELGKLALEPLVLDAILRAVADGVFAKFRGAGHISAKAARNIIPHLLRGLTYDKACAEAGYRHTDRVETEITNPVARKALLEAEKQIRAIAQQYGTPDKIHIELARDIGKSAEERAEIERGIEMRNKVKDKLRDFEFPEVVGRAPLGRDELLRFELWKEQAGRCAYSDEIIHPSQISASDNSVQVDHILPWSRFGDDSFHNRALCLARENQHKAGRTPFEWLTADKNESEWERFRARIETNKLLRGLKKRNYLLMNADEVEERFKTRNLNDTRYAARALMQRLENSYPAEPGRRRVFARPGSLTEKLRRAWGVNDLKKDPTTGKRSDDDRHHALDAIIVAATSEGTLQALTRAFQEAEKRGLAREFGTFDPPWPTFIDDVREAFDSITVSRAERRRARGKAHDATIKQVREFDGKSVVYERKPIDKLTEADLERIPVPEPYAKAADPAKLRDATVAALREWIKAGRPKDTPPRSPRGDVIKKVRVATTDKIGVSVRGGAADRSEIVRVDVFTNSAPGARAPYLYVPVYAHQVIEIMAPRKAFALRKPYEIWPEVGGSDCFLFSLNKFSFVRIKAAGEIRVGYFRGIDTNDGRISLTPQQSSVDANEIRLAPTKVEQISKLCIDRLGHVSEVPRETRTWRGKVCT